MIDITEESRKKVAEELSKVLADTYAIFLKTHNYHWNVVGPDFNDLHQMFEEQYTELFSATDEVAERIRALGIKAPATFKEFSELSVVKDGDSSQRSDNMLKDLAESHRLVVKNIRSAAAIAQENSDFGTMDLLMDRLQAHEKTLWMLESLLES